jgi:SAM-dependent methyltransferase
MIIKDITSEDSNRENVETWALEVGTRFESYSTNAVNEFIYYIKKYSVRPLPGAHYSEVLDLGCGDGAATTLLYDRKYDVVGVDINQKKLREIEAGPVIYQRDMYDFVKNKFAFFHVFTHHALEHTPDAPKIIEEIGNRMMPGTIYYAVVPAEDYLHSVHHVVFEDAEELLPPKCEPLLMERRDRFNEKEFVCIAKKIGF